MYNIKCENNEQVLENLNNVLTTLEKIASKKKTDKNEEINQYVLYKISTLRKKYDTKKYNKLHKRKILPYELTKVCFWTSLVLQDLYKKYYDNKKLRKQIKALGSKAFGYAELCKHYTFPFLTPPSPPISSEESEEEKTDAEEEGEAIE